MTAEVFSRGLVKTSKLFPSWLLSMVCISALLYVYTETSLNLYSALAIIASAGLFLLFDFIRREKTGGLIFAVLSVIIILASFLIAENAENSWQSFVFWFISGAQAVTAHTEYLIALTLLTGFFLTAAIYYFSQITYRSFMLMLITLIPFALAVKAVLVLPYAYAAAAAAINLLIFIIDARSTLLKASKPSGGSAFMVYAEFYIAAVLLALIIPKASVTPFYEKFEEFSKYFSVGQSGGYIYQGEYKHFSGTSDKLLKGEKRLLYTINTTDPSYMKTQVFDVYDNDLRGWTTLKEGVNGTRQWQDKNILLSFELLSDSLNKIAGKAPDIYGKYPQAERLSELSESESMSMIFTVNFPTVYLLAPLRTVSSALYDIETEFCACSEAGEIFTDRRALPSNARYAVRYYSEDIFDELIQNGFCDISHENYKNFLLDAYFWADWDSDEYNVLQEFYEQCDNAEKYRQKTETAVSEDIRNLAEKLTNGLKYDYQKAEAIERYFLNGDYVYDLAYEAPDELDTPEYFIFESQKGICSDFATAFTLIARASGLTVRYVEGFVPQPSDEGNNMYYIYTDNAHAYPEVYIPGAGWVIYEPTPADLMSGSSSRGNNNNTETDYVAIFLISVAVICGITAFILLVILTPKYMECIFRIKIRLADGSKAVILLYNRHARNIELKFGISCKAFTPEQLAKFTEKETGLPLDLLINPFIKACYGGENISTEEKTAAFDCYKLQTKAVCKALHKSKNKHK